MHVDHVLYITDLPRECIADCSASGSVDDAVAHWLRELSFTVDRERAIRCLQGYGAWDDLATDTDEQLAARVLWLACGDFSEFITYAESAGVDPFGERPDDFDPPCGSDLFCLE